MKYAIISDIHGNLPAFEAALDDARTYNPDMYLLLGDYTNGFPWGNGVAETIRGLGSARIIRGNGEGYLIDLQSKNQDSWSCEQFKPVYWAYRSLSKVNLDYVLSLPEKAVLSDKNVIINLTHSMSVFYRKPTIDFFNPLNFHKIMEVEPFSHKEYLSLAKEALLSRPDAVKDIRGLPKGVYLFGHNHLQFYMEYDGKLFINPGSCGESIDWDSTASYTLLDVSEGNWIVSERRIPYDFKAVADKLNGSGYKTYAPVWSWVMEKELMTGKDFFTPLVLHLIDTGRKLGRNEYPVSNDVWSIAVETWDPLVI